MNFVAQKATYDRDIQAVEPEMPGVLYWLGKPYPAQRNEISDTLLGTDFGYVQQYDFQILVRSSVYPAGITPPVTEDQIEYQDSATPRLQLIIKSIKPSQDGVSWIYDLKAST